MVRTIKTKIIVMNEGEHVQIEPYGKHIVRVRVSADEIQDLDWTLLPKEGAMENGKRYPSEGP